MSAAADANRIVADDALVPRSAPWPVIAAFYLWLALIAAQALGLVYIGFSLGLAARIGGPAWDILFVDALPGLLTLGLSTAEVVLVLRMRAGGWNSRTWLAVLALPAAYSVVATLGPIAYASALAANSVGFTSSPANDIYLVRLWSILIGAILIAVAAAILPFTRPVGGFFRKRVQSTPDEPGPTGSVDSVAPTGSSAASGQSEEG